MRWLSSDGFEWWIVHACTYNPSNLMPYSSGQPATPYTPVSNDKADFPGPKIQLRDYQGGYHLLMKAVPYYRTEHAEWISQRYVDNPCLSLPQIYLGPAGWLRSCALSTRLIGDPASARGWGIWRMIGGNRFRRSDTSDIIVGQLVGYNVQPDQVIN